MRDFLKKIESRLKNVDLLRTIFWKTLTFMMDFLKKVDLVMKNVDLYLNLEMWIFNHHVGVWGVIFLNKYFHKKIVLGSIWLFKGNFGLFLRKFQLLHLIFLSFWKIVPNVLYKI